MPVRPSLCSGPGAWAPLPARDALLSDPLSLRAGLLLAVLLGVLMPCTARAQDVPPPLPTPRPDTTAAPPDTLAAPRPADTLDAPPRPREAAGAGLDQPVTFSATDSLRIVFGDDGDRGRLVGDATVTYGDVTLEGHAIDLLFEISELRADGLETDSGTVGRPRFAQASEAFTGRRFAYNLETRRGRVVQAQTQIEDGFIRADVTKVTEDSTLYVLDGLYTTCDCGPDETPSYSLRSRRMKVVDQTWIYTGPIQLYIYDIPTILWLPFGFLPAREGRRSGLLPPEYGEDQRGFYLRNWGYYWAINEYVDLQVRFGLWTKGSWQVNPSFRYNRRYRYGGSLNLDFVREQSGERDDPDLVVRNDVRLAWQHSQTLNPTTSARANVNLASSSYLRTVSEQYTDNVRQQVSSSVQFEKRWPQGGRSLSANVRQNQVFATGNVQLTLPDVRFTQSSRTPFRRAVRAPGQDQRWYERITVSYTGSLRNNYSFTPLPADTLLARGDSAATGIAWYEALVDPSKYERATGDETPFDFRATHSLPVSAPFSITRIPVINRTVRLTVSPNASYNEDWFLETERQTALDTTGRRVERVREPGFFALRRFSTGVSANTTFYGLFPVAAGPYQGVRHTVRPTLSFSFSPDYGSDFWGYSRVLEDAEGVPVRDATGVPIRYRIRSEVPTGERRVLSFGLDNVFETKRVREDSTGEAQSRVLKLFNLNLNSSYNFAADSLRLAPITLSARTNILGKLNVNAGATLDPYGLDTLGRRIDRFVFSAREARLARLTTFRVNADFSIRSGRGGDGRQRQPGQPFQNPNLDLFQSTQTSTLGAVDPFGERPYDDPRDGFADFTIPWSLDVDFSYSLSRFGASTSRSVTVNTTFDFNLTPLWKVRGRSGYDFERGEIVTTSLNILRDFECWEMSVRWVPFGQFQSWGFDLHVKSGHLRDLLRLRQPRAERDRGFGL